MRRILFVAEAVTLAQVVRLATLARALDPARYEVHFASARFDELVFGGARFVRHPIRSLSPATVESRVARGARLYGGRTLAAYVREERALFQAVRPDLVVGDLRLSLAVSAPVERIPYAALINAYWSPFATEEGFPLPDHPIVRLLGVARATRYFPRALPFVFRHFARPINRLRRRQGLAELGTLPEVLTFADHTLFPDTPALVPTRGLPPHQRYLGHVPWSPPVALPAWWSRLDRERPTVYVTLGSSGRVQNLPAVIDAAASLGCQVLVATAGRARLGHLPPHVFAADYLPGELAARRAAVVVSNGGSTTGYQALAAGRPVLGLPFNLDQYLASRAVARAAAGLAVRSGQADRSRVAAALSRLLTEPSFAAEAARLAVDLGRSPGPATFAAFVASALT
ncbi:MAG TPA: nucleotide disphospho-sugar-binding domain-containing protein [Polyangia bacterium]|nr:nucleotide disphospho-sugar-binding domain-containing protein [Polyangia bacterium]